MSSEIKILPKLYDLMLSKDTDCITVKEYEYASKEIDEIGKMTGGWIKNQNNAEENGKKNL
ncbi:MAG: four helix bundle protein [Candidatus Delongbacteria bacterium]|nr:four helix bundle protein [Candidatus Delongbacteria bacterium]